MLLILPPSLEGVYRLVAIFWPPSGEFGVSTGLGCVKAPQGSDDRLLLVRRIIYASCQRIYQKLRSTDVQVYARYFISMSFSLCVNGFCWLFL